MIYIYAIYMHKEFLCWFIPHTTSTAYLSTLKEGYDFSCSPRGVLGFPYPN